MASLQDIYIKKENLETLLKAVNKKGLPGIGLTIVINDGYNEWGQNVSAYVSQTKEQREAKQKRFYVGNGRVFWSNGNPAAVENKEPNLAQDNPDSEMPF